MNLLASSQVTITHTNRVISPSNDIRGLIYKADEQGLMNKQDGASAENPQGFQNLFYNIGVPWTPKI